MAIQINNLVTAGLKGALGKQVVFRQRNGKTILSAYPDMSGRKLSAKQLEVNKTMVKANAFAKSIIYDEQKCKDEMYKRNLPKTRLYTTLVKEYFKENYKAAGK
jgi:hypothetical protein